MLPMEDDPRQTADTSDPARGNGSAAVGYPFKYRNCRRSKLPKPVQTHNSHNKYPSEETLYNEPNLVPKMELLKINYFNMPRKSTVQLKTMASRSRTAMQDIKDDLIKKCGGSRVTEHSSSNGGKSIKVPEISNSKYAVYKKHNLLLPPHDQHRQRTSTVATEEEEKNSKVFDSVKFRKKYFLFDTKKRSKLDNIQFYFDNKSYERHVDNKLYGSAQRPSSHYSQAGGQGSMNRRDHQKSQPPTSKLSSWKDHLNNTRLGSVRELQNKYENHTRQTQANLYTSDSNRVYKRPPRNGPEDLKRQHEKSGQYGSDDTDTDKTVKSKNGSYQRQHHHHGSNAVQRPEDPSTMVMRLLKQKKYQSNISRRESTANESSKIKRLVEDFEKKSPAPQKIATVEGRENFILFQRMSSTSNLTNHSAPLTHKYASNSGSPKTTTTTAAGGGGVLRSNNELAKKETNYYLNSSTSQRQPLCKNIRTPRPTSMPIINGRSQMVTNERMPPSSVPPSSPQASATTTPEKSVKHCGYKNCQFQNCPMTASSSSTSSGCDSSSSSTLSFASDEKFTSPINIVHRNHSKESESSSSVINKSNLPKSRTERISNIKQLERRIVTKYISEEMRLLNNGPRQEEEDNEDDGYEPISSSTKDSERDYERNKVKIYVGGTVSGDKKSSFLAETIEDSDKDYGYYDQVTADSSGSCSEDSYGCARVKVQVSDAKEISDDSLVNIMDMRSDLMGKLGCDGAIFWNEQCYEEECKVQCSVKEPYVCVCGSSLKVNGKSFDINIGHSTLSLEIYIFFVYLGEKIQITPWAVSRNINLYCT